MGDLAGGRLAQIYRPTDFDLRASRIGAATKMTAGEIPDSYQIVCLAP